MHFTRCTAEDIDVLIDIASETFIATYGHLNTEANMKEYLEKNFDRDLLLSKIADERTRYLFLHDGDARVGYIQLNEGDAQSDIRDPDSLEIERIYVREKYQGKGYGRQLFEKALETAKAMDKTYIWLGVWDQNHKALAFYGRCGFYRAGEHTFVLGDDHQVDYIMRLDLK